MRDYKRIPKISPSVKQLIAKEALRNRGMPRDYLAQELADKIRALGEIPPTEETLKRKISDARQHIPEASPYWSFGWQSKMDISIEVDAIPRIIEIQRALKKISGHTIRIPISVAYWIGQLHRVVESPSPMRLYAIARTYALFQLISIAAEPNGTEALDTSELDNLLIERDYEALTKIGEDLMSILPEVNDKNAPDDVMARVHKAIKDGEA